MSEIQDRIDEIAELVQQVRNHPMCARFTDEHGVYLVIYPEGYWPMGVQVTHTGRMGKATALRRLLLNMENHWRRAL